MVWGDATSSSSYYTSNTNTASFYQSGGNMDANAADYSITVFQSENGNLMDIDITAAYTGSGTKTVTIYAAVTEDTSPESYDGGGPNPHHVFRQWLLNGVGNAFESVTLTGGNPVTKSWSIPISVVRPGGGNSAADNFPTVAALLDGDHTTAMCLLLEIPHGSKDGPGSFRSSLSVLRPLMVTLSVIRSVLLHLLSM